VSEIEDSIATLIHMDSALAAMRQGLAVVRERNTNMVGVVTELWGNGNELAGRIATELMAAEAKLEETDHALLHSQVAAVHAMVILQQVNGGNG
jgi:hypothetical protein